jgi:hypothetical protein
VSFRARRGDQHEHDRERLPSFGAHDGSTARLAVHRAEV